MSARRPDASDRSVPLFFLFGEPLRLVSSRFLHVETLEERSRPSNWNIRAHAHTDLHHLFLISAGAGSMNVDGRITRFTAPCVLTIPARSVHGFTWKRDTRGNVLTLADGYLRDLLAREPEFSPLFEQSVCLQSADAAAVGSHLTVIGRELAWSAPGHAAAIGARMQIVLVEALRLLRQQTPNAAMPRLGRSAALVARFRELVEAHYRSGVSLSHYVNRLGVGPATLRRACLQVAGGPPMQILHDRILLEAQRLLLFSNMSINEAATTLGFEDSAYFTRFFTQRAGRSPRAFRVSGRTESE